MKAQGVSGFLSLTAGLGLVLGQAVAADNNAWNRAHGGLPAERQPFFSDPVVVTNPPARSTDPASLEGLVTPRLVTNAEAPVPGGVSGTPSSSTPPVRWGLNQKMDSLDAHQKVERGYRLIFRVVEDQEDPKFLSVTATGELDVPELGLVPVVGKSCKELAFELKKKLEQTTYFQATVLLGIDSTPPVNGSGPRIYVGGFVQRPGQLEIPGGEPWTVAQAVIRAGGLAPRGDGKRVRLTRPAKGGMPSQTIVVNVVEVWAKGRTEKDQPVQAGDFIYVPEQVWGL
jgi:polysaccharide biosynthesis/export protein